MKKECQLKMVSTILYVRKDARLTGVKEMLRVLQTSSPWTTTVTGQSNCGFYHIWVWSPSWSRDLETLLTSAEELLSGLCILFSAILVHLKKNHLARSGSYNDPRGGAIFDPRGKIGRIYVELHMTMLYIKYTS